MVGQLIKPAPGQGHGPKAVRDLEALKLDEAPEGELGDGVVLNNLATSLAVRVSEADAPLAVVLNGLGYGGTSNTSRLGF